MLAMAKARQFEAEFESIQKEWNCNHRMRNTMLTSWPENDQMYPSWWDENNEWTLPRITSQKIGEIRLAKGGVHTRKSFGTERVGSGEFSRHSA